VIKSVAEPLIAGASHEDGPLLSALASHRGNASEGTDGVVVSGCDGPRGLGEHRGGDESSHSWQRTEDDNVAMLAFLRLVLLRGELIEKTLDLAVAGATLVVEKAKSW